MLVKLRLPVPLHQGLCPFSAFGDIVWLLQSKTSGSWSLFCFRSFCGEKAFLFSIPSGQACEGFPLGLGVGKSRLAGTGALVVREPYTQPYRALMQGICALLPHSCFLEAGAGFALVSGSGGDWLLRLLYTWTNLARFVLGTACSECCWVKSLRHWVPWLSKYQIRLCCSSGRVTFKLNLTLKLMGV